MDPDAALFDGWEEREAEFQARQEKWDRRFLELAEFVARWSKDPSTQTGAVITRDNRVVSVGYNGFPCGTNDSPELYADRAKKYQRVVHCEVNAILTARQDLTDCTLYTWPFSSCSRCCGIVIQSGITRCVAPKLPTDKAERWAEDMAVAAEMFAEAGVELVLV